jgi:hypothetical protein
MNATDNFSSLNRHDTNYLVCKFCNKYYEVPIVLPCGNLCCRDHLQLLIDHKTPVNGKKVVDFLCLVCDTTHPILISSEYGFKVDERIRSAVRKMYNSKPQIEKAKRLMAEIEALNAKCNMSDTDLKNLIFEQCSATIKKIDLHVGSLIEKLAALRGSAIDFIEKFSNDCCQNLSNRSCINKNLCEKLFENAKQINENKNNLRIPDLQTERLDEIVNKLQKSVDVNTRLIDELIKGIFMGRKIVYEPPIASASLDAQVSQLFGRFGLEERETELADENMNNSFSSSSR